MKASSVLDIPLLEPCPFCGGEGQLCDGVTPDQWPTARVRCAVCRASTKSIPLGRYFLEVSAGCFIWTERLLAARDWNSRPEQGTAACPQCGVAVPHTHEKRERGYQVKLAGPTESE